VLGERLYDCDMIIGRERGEGVTHKTIKYSIPFNLNGELLIGPDELKPISKTEKYNTFLSRYTAVFLKLFKTA
jgi:hypothetical protein